MQPYQGRRSQIHFVAFAVPEGVAAFAVSFAEKADDIGGRSAGVLRHLGRLKLIATCSLYILSVRNKETGMRKIKLITMVVLVSALGAVILQNRNPVQVHFLLMTLQMPLVLLLLLTAGLGFALGLLAALFSSSKTREQKK